VAEGRRAVNAARTLKLYRMWRTVTLLCALGAVEFAVLAWMRRSWWAAAIAVPLVTVAGLAGRRAAHLRRTFH
jgi:hypothetical protein